MFRYQGLTTDVGFLLGSSFSKQSVNSVDYRRLLDSDSGKTVAVAVRCAWSRHSLGLKSPLPHVW